MIQGNSAYQQFKTLGSQANKQRTESRNSPLDMYFHLKPFIELHR